MRSVDENTDKIEDREKTTYVAVPLQTKPEPQKDGHHFSLNGGHSTSLVGPLFIGIDWLCFVKGRFSFLSLMEVNGDKNQQTSH